MQPTASPEKPKKEATPKESEQKKEIKVDDDTLKRMIADAFPDAPDVPIYPNPITETVYRANWIKGMVGAEVVFSRMVALRQTPDGPFIEDLTIDGRKRSFSGM